jgi:hypothetical protein
VVLSLPDMPFTNTCAKAARHADPNVNPTPKASLSPDRRSNVVPR